MTQRKALADQLQQLQDRLADLRDGDLLWKQVGGLPCDITNIATRLDCALYAVKMARIRAESIVRTGTALADAAQGGAA